MVAQYSVQLGGWPHNMLALSRHNMWLGGVMVRMLGLPSKCQRVSSTPGWVDIKWLLPGGWLSADRQTISVYNQSPRSTQPSIHPGYVNRVPACLAGVKAGRVHLCWVAGYTVWSHMAGDCYVSLLCGPHRDIHNVYGTVLYFLYVTVVSVTYYQQRTAIPLNVQRRRFTCICALVNFENFQSAFLAQATQYCASDVKILTLSRHRKKCDKYGQFCLAV